MSSTISRTYQRPRNHKTGAVGRPASTGELGIQARRRDTGQQERHGRLGSNARRDYSPVRQADPWRGARNGTRKHCCGSAERSSLVIELPRAEGGWQLKPGRSTTSPSSHGRPSTQRAGGPGLAGLESAYRALKPGMDVAFPVYPCPSTPSNRFMEASAEPSAAAPAAQADAGAVRRPAIRGAGPAPGSEPAEALPGYAKVSEPPGRQERTQHLRDGTAPPCGAPWVWPSEVHLQAPRRSMGAREGLLPAIPSIEGAARRWGREWACDSLGLRVAGRGACRGYVAKDVGVES